MTLNVGDRVRTTEEWNALPDGTRFEMIIPVIKHGTDALSLDGGSFWASPGLRAPSAEVDLTIKAIPTDPAVEAVAQALMGAGVNWEKVCETDRDLYRERARVSIAALRAFEKGAKK